VTRATRVTPIRLSIPVRPTAGGVYSLSVPAGKERVRAFALSWLAYASYYLCRKPFSVAKTSLEEELRLSERDLAWIDTGYLAAYALGQFVWGVLGDRLGPRRLLGLGMLASAVLTFVPGASGAAVAVAALTVMNGLAQSTGWSAAVKAMTPWFQPRERGLVMGLWSTCYQVGGLAAGALAAYLVKHHGWREAFMVPAAEVAVVGALVLLTLPDVAPAPAPERRAARGRLVRNPALWSLSFAYFCLKLIRYSLLFWLPYYLEKSLHYGRGDAGYQSIAFEAGGVVGAVVVGLVSDRVFAGRRGLAGLLGCAGLAGAFLVYLAVSRAGPVANFAGLGLVGFLLFGPDALISGAAAQDLGGTDSAATAAGFINGVGSVGAVLQGLLTAEVSLRYGWDALFLVFVGLAVVAAMAMVPRVLAERRTRAGEA
jgi:sugar phosphate permease